MTDVPQSVRGQLESLPHVVGTAIGKKRVNGEKTDETSVIVFVDRKVAETQLADEEQVPETVDWDSESFRTDVQEVGDVTALAIEPLEGERTERVRPAPGGVSVAHPVITAGTMGSTTLATDDDETVVLTNAHVAAPTGEAEEGDPLLQPGPEDGGGEVDEIGELREWSVVEPGEINTTDSALVAVDPDDIEDEILGIGPLVEFDEPDIETDDEYAKSGRTTGVTTGELRGRDARIEVGGFGDEPAIFEGVDVFTSMADPGDSGSLIGVTEPDFTATNLLFAGSDDATIGIPMPAVEDEHGELTPTEGKEDNKNGSDNESPDFRERVRERLESEYGTDAIGADDEVFRVEAWPLDLTVIATEDLTEGVMRAWEVSGDTVITIPEGSEAEIPEIPAGVTVVPVKP